MNDTSDGRHQFLASYNYKNETNQLRMCIHSPTIFRDDTSSSLKGYVKRIFLKALKAQTKAFKGTSIINSGQRSSNCFGFKLVYHNAFHLHRGKFV